MSLGLVAYGASSDEDSDNESSEESIQVQIIAPTPKLPQSSPQVQVPNDLPTRKNLSLPKPTNASNDGVDTESDVVGLTLNLPEPSRIQNALIEEEDDEFLHKKVAPSLVQKPVANPRAPNKRQPVKITIPSLSEYDDAADTKPDKVVTVLAEPKKASGLLGMLPAPKGSSVLGKSLENSNAKSSTAIETKKTTSLVPDSVTNRLKATPKPSQQIKKTAAPSKPSLLGTNYGQSDDSDDSDAEDFFSLNRDEKLPEVSASEINAMVAKQAGKMAQAARSLEQQDNNASVSSGLPSSAAVYAQNEYSEAQASGSSKLVGREVADIEALCGARVAKRARKDDIQFIEISQEQVTMGRDEWARNQLQAETEYQPRGLINDPGAGTKKKHQITYLAYQAKANEQELQAMWAANRHARRQTQSKYGF